jgi:hypothetical protein
MKKKKSFSIGIVALGLLWACLAHAQASVNASGGNATGSGGTAAYSIGQVFYTTNTGNSGSVAQGVQHAYEIFSVGTKETTLNISLSVFPNPTVDHLTLDISDYHQEELWYQMFDIQGRMVNSGQIASQQTRIDMHNLLPATYFLTIVNQNHQKIQSFKIIKIQ